MSEANGTAPGANVHLLVLIHGMWGNPGHLAEMKRIYKEKLCQENSQKGPSDESMHVLVVETNRESATYDGIDWGGERVADEVCASRGEYPKSKMSWKMCIDQARNQKPRS